MPQPISSVTAAGPGTAPAQRPLPRQRSARRDREDRWKTLVVTYRLLSRLATERTHHHLVDAADDLALQAANIDEDLARSFPVRWPRRRAELLLEEAAWWVEEHDDDPLACTTCWLLNGIADEGIDVPPPRRAWA